MNQGLQTEIASGLNLKCLSTFYFCPECLLRATRLSGTEPSCEQSPGRARSSSSRASHRSTHRRWLVFPQMACVHRDGLHSPRWLPFTGMACIHPAQPSANAPCIQGQLFSAATAGAGSKGWVTTLLVSTQVRAQHVSAGLQVPRKTRENHYLTGII